MKNLHFKNLYGLFIVTILMVSLLLSCKEEYDHTIDVMNPQVVSYNPVSGVKDISINSDLFLTFDKKIKKGKGNVTIDGGETKKVIDVSSDEVVISEDGRILTIHPGEMESDQQYTITLDRGTVTDLLGNEFIGTTTEKPWIFTTAGDVGPLLVSTAPENEAKDGSLIRLELNFLAEVMKGEGNISVFEAASGKKVAEIPVAGAAVQTQKKKVVVNLPAPLEFSKQYYVTVDNGAIVDINKKKFKGFSTSTDWNFTTTPGSGNELVFHLPFDGSLADESGNRFDASLGINATASPEFVNDEVRGKVVKFVPGSYAVLPKHDLLRPSNSQNFSVNIWVKLNAIGSDPVLFANSDWDSGGNPGMIFCINGALEYKGPGSPGRGWLVNMAGNGRIDWRANEMEPQAPPLADGKWHMVSVVVNQDTKKMHVYIDGKEYSNKEKAASFDLTRLAGPLWDEENDFPFTIWEDGTGKYNAGSDTRKNLDGYIDDLRYYNKLLTQADINRLLNQ